jgi:methyl-accepting chemotaxis protein
MAEVQYKRKQIIVDANLQVGLSVNVLAWLYFYILMFMLVVNAPWIWSIFTSSAADPAYHDAVQRLQWFTRFAVVPLACMFVCVAAHGVVFAHRVAGPIFRIKATLRDLAAGKLPNTPVRLRPKDYLKDVATDLSTMIDSIRDDVARRRRMNQETMDGARELLAAVEAGKLGRPELLALAQTTLDRAARLDRHVEEPFATSVGAAAPTSAPAAGGAPVDAMSVTR